MTSRTAIALSSLLLLGCPQKQDPAKGAGGGAPVDNQLKSLEGVRVVIPKETRDADGNVAFTVGQLTGTLPRGWTSMSFGGQTTWRSPDFQETLRIVGYSSEKELDEERQRAIQTSLNELAMKAEKVLTRFGAQAQLSPPTGARTPWGTTSRFTALGPFNRVAFHYAAVARHEAILIQLDGNSMVDTPGHAAALMQSIKYKADAAPAPSAPAPSAPAPSAPAPSAPAK